MERFENHPQGEVMPQEAIEALQRELSKTAIDIDNPCIVMGEE